MTTLIPKFDLKNGGSTPAGAINRSINLKLQETVSIKDFGAVCDGVTDDTVAFQAAVNSIGDTSSIRRSGITLNIPGPTLITDTILIQQKSFTLTGNGWGIIPDTNGRSSYIRWGGAAGKAMLRINNCSGGMLIQNIAFKGSTTNVPLAAIELYQTAGIINSGNSFSNIAIGSNIASDDPGTQFQYGIVSTGINANDAEQFFNKIQIVGCSVAGIQQSFQQNTNWHLNDLDITQCAIAVSLAAGVVGNQWNLNLNGIDINTIGPVDSLGNSTIPNISVQRYQSEQSGRLCYLSSTANLTIDSGAFAISASTNADGRIVYQPQQNANCLFSISNFSFQTIATPPASPYMYFKSAVGGGTPRNLIFNNIQGWDNLTGGVNGLDITTQSNVDGASVYLKKIDSAQSGFKQRISQQFLGGSTANRDFDITAYEIPASAPSTVFYDDFIGNTLDSNKWVVNKGSNGSCTNAAIVAGLGGIIEMNTGADAGGTMALNGTQLSSSLNWQGGQGGLTYEFRVKLSAITNVAIFLGLTDQNSTLEMPFTLAAGNVLTSNASNAVGVLYDTAADTDNWWLVGVTNDVDATKQNSGYAPVANTYEKWHVEISTNGEAKFYRKGVFLGTVMTGAVAANVSLTPVIAAFSRSAASVTVTCDKVFVQENE
jgi:hypothetical protein